MPANDRRSRSKDRRSRSKGRRQRRMRIYDEKGSFYVVVRMPTTASRIARYHNAVRRFVQTGDASKLREATGWAPTIPLEQTLTDALDAARAAVAERMASA